MQIGDGKVKRIGVLALQGGVEEHLKMLEQIEGVKPIAVKNKEELDDLDGLILPGGESTTIGNLLRTYELIDPIREKVQEGLPIWGTCAGMILLAKEIENEDVHHLGVMDIKVRRNAYGRQLGSFQTSAIIKEISSEPLCLTFIRAPYVSEVKEPEVEVLLKENGHIVACKQKNMLATAFHPELTKDCTFHKYFVEKFVK